KGLGLVQSALRGDLRHHLDDAAQRLEVEVLDEFERRLLESRVTAFRSEARRQLGEQGAALARLAAIAEPHREQEAELEVFWKDPPRAPQRVHALGLLLQAFVRAHEQVRAGR